MITRQVINLQAGKSITLEVLDARCIKLTTGSLLITQFPVDSQKPTRLHIANEIYIDTKNPFHKFIFPIGTDRNMSYDVRIIKRIELGKYLLLTHDRTVCSYFLPAMLSDSMEFGKHKTLDRNWFGWTNYFMNAYFVILPENIRPSGNGYCIGLLYRFIPVEGFRTFEHKLKSHSMYLMNYEMDVDTTLMLFSVPEQFKADMYLILHSKYSLISNKLKDKVLSFGQFDKRSDMGKILNRDPNLKKQLELSLGAEIDDDVELLEKIDVAKELISINNYGKTTGKQTE